jgi:hypothetical protein
MDTIRALQLRPSERDTNTARAVSPSQPRWVRHGRRASPGVLAAGARFGLQRLHATHACHTHQACGAVLAGARLMCPVDIPCRSCLARVWCPCWWCSLLPRARPPCAAGTRDTQMDLTALTRAQLTKLSHDLQEQVSGGRPATHGQRGHWETPGATSTRPRKVAKSAAEGQL